MLSELDLATKNRPCTFTPDMFRCSQQILEGVDLKHMLEFAGHKEEVLSTRRAKKIMEEVQIPELSDHIDVRNPELVMEQFKGYEEKVKNASSEIGDNLNVYLGSLPVLKAVKRVLLRLERICLLKSVNSKRMCLWNPDDDIKLLEKSHDAAQKAMKAGQSGKTSNRFKELLNLVASCNVRQAPKIKL
ncbi:uncharacterized protein LOC113313535 [Papaver somniferum]|uniref:uncharacterized protein LOC113313535 n=1 Tax=Papaver somniferum TaxID=3469 RepID=UPI000E6F8426|nr:uncharacterized protein LOC113313535 [Papaver somniferum]XP_026418111.1 uncharacterized protein LOC113313535 [Papaver somniferum]XP_026418112.1 uncharacterized protein LOC113313535 [Papaver somniferum]